MTIKYDICDDDIYVFHPILITLSCYFDYNNDINSVLVAATFEMFIRVENPEEIE